MLRLDPTLLGNSVPMSGARPATAGAADGTPPAAAPAPSPTEIPADIVKLSQLPAHARRVSPIVDAQEAMTVQAPVLERPVLMVHGLAQRADTFATMKLFLCSEPANKFGGVFDVAREGEFVHRVASETPDAKVFAIDISDNLAAPRVVANEIRRAIDAITAATGATGVDVMTHSMGSLVAREAIHQGESRIQNLIMISPPSHGSYEATLASTLYDANVYKHYPAEYMGAMDALRLEYDSRGNVKNEWLHELNEWWAANPNVPRSTVITGIGLPTPDLGSGATSPGDGMVAARRAAVDGADFLLAVPNQLPAEEDCFRDFQMFRYNHLQIVSEPEIHREVAQFLSSASSSTSPSQSPVGSLTAELTGLPVSEGAESPSQSPSVPTSGMANLLSLQPGLAPTAGTVQLPSAEALPEVEEAAHTLAPGGVAGAGPSQEGYLSHMQDRTRDLRGELVASEIRRRSFVAWQHNGTSIAASGAGIAALGAAAACCATPVLGLALMVVGGAGLVSGTLTALKNTRRLNEENDRITKASEEALNLVEELAHRGAEGGPSAPPQPPITT